MTTAGGAPAAPPPAAGAIVMATGIVSVVLLTAGAPVLSDVLLWLAVAAWTVLAGWLAAAAAAGHRRELSLGARSPAALSAVAGTCVVGARWAQGGWATAADVALGLGAAAWLALQLPVWRHWRTPTVGTAFMVTVSAESLAVLCAALATPQQAPWLVVAGAALAVVGVALYAVVVARFDARQILTGAGDQWVAGGALAIAALATADLAGSARGLGLARWVGDDLETAAEVVAAAAAAWLPVVLAGELLRPRLGYDLRRWATVFPVAMYSAAGTAVARLNGWAGLEDVARWWGWVAVAVWAVVGLGGLTHAGRAWNGAGTVQRRSRDA